MSFFNSILQKLGIGKDEPAATASAAPSAPVAASTKPVAPAAAAPSSKPAVEKPSFDLGSVPVAISEVDVVAKLEKMSAGSGLNWQVSIVDLLKVLDIDSSREARNALATELGCPEDLMKDSAKMNVWLHKEVLKRIAKNGGNIPQNLLD